MSKRDDGHDGECDAPSGEVYGHLSGELLDVPLVREVREKERENPVVRRLQANRGRIGLCEIQACCHADSMGSTNGLLCGDPCIVLCKTGVELGSHAVQRSEKHTV